MDLSMQKEQFSNAYVRAVASVAGFAVYKPEVDNDSVDWGIAQAGGQGTIRSPRVELQLKCTARDILDEDKVSFPLDVKNYNELRPENFAVPRILVVVVVPQRLGDWLNHSEEELAMRYCGYWLSLRGEADTANDKTITVHLPRNQQFTVNALQAMMRRVEQGGSP